MEAVKHKRRDKEEHARRATRSRRAEVLTVGKGRGAFPAKAKLDRYMEALRKGVTLSQ